VARGAEVEMAGQEAVEGSCGEGYASAQWTVAAAGVLGIDDGDGGVWVGWCGCGLDAEGEEFGVEVRF